MEAGAEKCPNKYTEFESNNYIIIASRMGGMGIKEKPKSENLIINEPILKLIVPFLPFKSHSDCLCGVSLCDI